MCFTSGRAAAGIRVGVRLRSLRVEGLSPVFIKISHVTIEVSAFLGIPQQHGKNVHIQCH